MPPSPVVAGHDNIPCGNAASYPSPLFGPGSPGSPRSGGIEALRLGRQSSLTALGTSPTGTSTPYGNLSLAAAAAGGGAPGSLTPPNAVVTKDGKEKKEGLYPSRVVLTSESGRPTHL